MKIKIIFQWMSPWALTFYALLVLTGLWACVVGVLDFIRPALLNDVRANQLIVPRPVLGIFELLIGAACFIGAYIIKSETVDRWANGLQKLIWDVWRKMPPDEQEKYKP